MPGAAAAWLRARHGAAGVPPAVHPDDEAARWFAEVLVPSCDVRLAVDSDAVVGVLAVSAHEVEQLYVVPERTGQGIGALLLGQAQALRPGGLDLWCFQANTGALRFYARHGFVEVERTDGSGNEERAPDVRLRWNGQPTQA